MGNQMLAQNMGSEVTLYPCKTFDPTTGNDEWHFSTSPCDNDLQEVEVIGHYNPKNPIPTGCYTVCPYCNNYMTCMDYDRHMCAGKYASQGTSTPPPTTVIPSPPSGGESGGRVEGGGPGSQKDKTTNSPNKKEKKKLEEAPTVDSKTANKAVNSAVYSCIADYGTSMACNIGVQRAVSGELGYLPPDLKGTANTIHDNLQKSSEWYEVSQKDANFYANRGCIVVAVWKGGHGHGHIVLLRHSDGNNTMVMDTGPKNVGKHARQSFNKSFNKNIRKQVRYFVYLGH